MNPNRSLVLMLVLPILAGSWLLIAIFEPRGIPGIAGQIHIGFIVGTMFGQTTLASAWTALGPLPLLWRLPLSLCWIAILLIALLVNLAVHSNPNDIEILLVLGACLTGQWLLVQ